MVDFDELELKLEARAESITRFLAANESRSFQAPASKDSGFAMVTVTPCTTYRGGWRCTRYGYRGARLEPLGHMECATYRDAVVEAAKWYGVDLGSVTFSEVSQ